MSLTEQIESVQWLRQRLELGARPSLDAAMLMRRPQHKMRSVRRTLTRSQRGSKRRGNGNAPLGVQPVLVGAEEARHSPLCLSGSTRVASGLGMSWDSMGKSGRQSLLRSRTNAHQTGRTAVPSAAYRVETKRQTACKPGSVRAAQSPAPRDDHSSRAHLAARLTRPTRTAEREYSCTSRHSRPYSVLLPVGFAVPPLLPGARCALAAPFRPCPRVASYATCAGGLFSVALSLGSPPPDVIRHRIPVEPGLSSNGVCRQRSSSRLTAKRWPQPRGSVKFARARVRRAPRICHRMARV